MKTLIAFAALTLLVGTPLAQQPQHATTVEQCRADQRLWLSRLEANNGARDITVGTLIDWQIEMDDCSAVDPTNSHAYDRTGCEIMAAKDLRRMHFLERHNLMKQFVDEDAAGER